jgi:tetratricopeptide (TPR) repeat protein
VSTVNRSARHDEAVLDVLKGEIALAEGKWQDAIPLFEISLRLSPEGDGMEPLARAYAAAQRWNDAVHLYSTMSTMYSRGTEQQEWIQVARFELGNLYSRRGDRVKARAAYEQFLDRWKDADAEIPMLREARKRLAELQ